MKTSKSYGINTTSSNKHDERSSHKPSKFQQCLVLVCSSLIVFFALGLANSFGVFYITLSQEFQISRSAVSIIGGLNYGIPFILSPCASFLLEKFSTRTVLAVGGIVYGAGYAAVFLTRSFISVVVCLGVVPGIGGTGVILMTVNLVGHYFDKHRARAISVMLIIICVGTMTWPHIIQTLTDAFTWKGACLVIGGLYFNVVPLAMCLKESPLHCDLHKNHNGIRRNIEGFKKESWKSINGEVYSTGHLAKTKRLSETSFSSQVTVTTEVSDPPSFVSSDYELKGVIDEKIHSPTQLNKNYDSRGDQVTQPSVSTSQKITTTLQSARLIFFVTQNIFYFVGVQGMFQYLPVYALEKGVEQHLTNWLITALGFSLMLGNPVYGHVGDSKFLKRHMTMIYCTSIFVGALSCLAVALCTTLPLMLLSAGVFGFTLSANYGLSPSIVIQYVSLRNFSVGYGLAMMTQGIGRVIAAPYAGYVYDLTGSYGTVFLACGGFMMVAVVLVLIEEVLHKCNCIKN